MEARDFCRAVLRFETFAKTLVAALHVMSCAICACPSLIWSACAGLCQDGRQDKHTKRHDGCWIMQTRLCKGPQLNFVASVFFQTWIYPISTRSYVGAQSRSSLLRILQSTRTQLVPSDGQGQTWATWQTRTMSNFAKYEILQSEHVEHACDYFVVRKQQIQQTWPQPKDINSGISQCLVLERTHKFMQTSTRRPALYASDTLDKTNQVVR